MEEIPDALYIKYYSTFKRIENDFRPQPKDLPPGTICGWWYWGRAGTGKSYQARLDFPAAYLKVPQNKWWDDYKGEENVILEDFDPQDKFMGRYFKQWVDEKCFRVEVKHGGMVIRPKRVCITSNWSIDQCWLDSETRDPLQRRFHQHEFTEVIDNSLMPKPEVIQRVSDGVLYVREMQELAATVEAGFGDIYDMSQTQDGLPY